MNKIDLLVGFLSIIFRALLIGLIAYILAPGMMFSDDVDAVIYALDVLVIILLAISAFVLVSGLFIQGACIISWKKCGCGGCSFKWLLARNALMLMSDVVVLFLVVYFLWGWYYGL